MQTLYREDGTSVNAIVPSWVKKKPVIDKSKLTAEERAALSYLVLIQNDKGSFTMAERWVADELIAENRAVEVERTDPDYVKAWGLAHGRAEGVAPGEVVQKNGQATRAFAHDSKKLDAEWAALLESQKKSPKQDYSDVLQDGESLEAAVASEQKEKHAGGRPKLPRDENGNIIR